MNCHSCRTEKLSQMAALPDMKNTKNGQAAILAGARGSAFSASRKDMAAILLPPPINSETFAKWRVMKAECALAAAKQAAAEAEVELKTAVIIADSFSLNIPHQPRDL